MLKRWYTKAGEWALRMRLGVEDERGIETLEWVAMAAVVFVIALGMMTMLGGGGPVMNAIQTQLSDTIEFIFGRIRG